MICFVYGNNNYVLTSPFYNREENENHPISIFINFWEKNYSTIPILRRDRKNFSLDFPNYVRTVNFTNLTESIRVSQTDKSPTVALVSRKSIIIRYLAFPLGLLFTWFMVLFYFPLLPMFY